MLCRLAKACGYRPGARDKCPSGFPRFGSGKFWIHTRSVTAGDLIGVRRRIAAVERCRAATLRSGGWTRTRAVTITAPEAPRRRGTTPGPAMALKDTLLRVFTWWNGQTVSLALQTARTGIFVGEDEFGNKYYKAEGALIDRSVGSERRWVVYNGYADASKVPPGWRGWLCHNVDLAPSEEDVSAARVAEAACREPDRYGERLPAAGLAAVLGLSVRLRPATTSPGPRATSAPEPPAPFCRHRSGVHGGPIPTVRRASDGAAGHPRLGVRALSRITALVRRALAPSLALALCAGPGRRRQDQEPDRGVLRPRQDHRPDRVVRGGGRRDRAVRRPAAHPAGLLHAAAHRERRRPRRSSRSTR